MYFFTHTHKQLQIILGFSLKFTISLSLFHTHAQDIFLFYQFYTTIQHMTKNFYLLNYFSKFSNFIDLD